MADAADASYASWLECVRCPREGCRGEEGLSVPLVEVAAPASAPGAQCGCRVLCPHCAAKLLLCEVCYSLIEDCCPGDEEEQSDAASRAVSVITCRTCGFGNVTNAAVRRALGLNLLRPLECGALRMVQRSIGEEAYLLLKRREIEAAQSLLATPSVGSSSSVPNTPDGRPLSEPSPPHKRQKLSPEGDDGRGSSVDVQRDLARSQKQLQQLLDPFVRQQDITEMASRRELDSRAFLLPHLQMLRSICSDEEATQSLLNDAGEFLNAKPTILTWRNSLYAVSNSRKHAASVLGASAEYAPLIALIENQFQETGHKLSQVAAKWLVFLGRVAAHLSSLYSSLVEARCRLAAADPPLTCTTDSGKIGESLALHTAFSVLCQQIGLFRLLYRCVFASIA